MLRNISFLLIFCAVLLACKHEKPKQQSLTKKEMDQLLIDSQRAYIKKEDKMMDDYAQDHHWDNTVISSTGIRYSIYRKGVGESYKKIKEQNNGKPIQVAIKYNSSLLDGTPCYSSSIDQPLIFTVGESEAISGLHELMTYLREGDRVQAVIPPRLAFGLAGDLKKVTPNSPVVYDIELLQWNY